MKLEKEVRPMGGYYASIAKSLERIADALEKMTAPSVDGREVAGKSDECGFPDELKEEMGRFQAAFEKAYGNGR